MAPVRRAYFERLYAASDDPWDFESSWYERRKYEVTVAALPEPRYRRAFEPGCSIGVLSELLARRCDHLLAVDLLPGPVARSADRLRGVEGVTVEQRCVPEEWPTGPFDLVVLSELAYYFEPTDLVRLLDAAVGSAAPGATLLAVHWRGVTDYPLTGDQTHRLIDATSGLHHVVRHLEEEFVLDVWRLPS
jgi:SAM-dependent methyltransferase